MDFLMLLPNGVRVVLEVDGKQHYAGTDSKADPDKYAAMAAADRDLRLLGSSLMRKLNVYHIAGLVQLALRQGQLE